MATRTLVSVMLLVTLATITRGQGETGIIGAKGCPGEAGASGPAGPGGSPGPTGSPGVLCGGIFTNAGTVLSPNYSNNYQNFARCTYTLTAANGGFIQLTFNDFDTETNYDFLNIVSDGVQIARYSGKTRPPVLTLGRTATLTFTSDCIITGRGFSVSFETIPATCGGLVFGSGLIRSPNYPSAYADNQVCVWGVPATQGNTVKLDFQAFNIERNYDWLELYEGKTLVARYTGTTIPPQATLGSAGRLVFRTDSSVQDTGFSISATSAALTCGGSISGYATINSPNYPSNYLPYSACTWTYRPLSTAVATRLTFSAFSLEPNYDFVKIYDDEALLTSYNGTTVPKSIVLRSRTITVVFTSDVNIELTGFRLQFTPLVIA